MTPVVVMDVTKRYRRRGPAVLDGVSVQLPPGSITQVRGNNGSGKSTLLRLLAGVTRPSSGRIASRPPVVGYVPERFPSDLPFTPLEYVRWLGAVRRLPEHRVGTRLIELAERLGLPAVALRQPMRDLSKGTTQKVALIQALLVSPSLLLLDEAWTGLDAYAQRALTEIVVDRRRDLGSVVVFADHGDRALGLAPDSTYLVHDGALTLVGRMTAASGANEDRQMCLELAGPVARAGELGALTGVRSTALRGDHVVVTVSYAETDKVLAAALASGWSVRRVQADLAEGDA
jgi:ABC-type multidrug transport system ATPase subunit